ncbi:hypothetical protein [Peterkaempfera bronchialis]|uniref:hypothetical protein n=1 Tax=Peterkaempfera bronchialis TaxID=2126346 RepID=UPI003C2B60E8
MAQRSESKKTMTKEEWIEQQLANAPEPTAEDVWWVLNRFGFPTEQVEAAYQAMLREKEKRAARRTAGALSFIAAPRLRATRRAGQPAWLTRRAVFS